MNLRQLRAFQEVMLTGSMTEAARNMGRTQPAVSAIMSPLSAQAYRLTRPGRGRIAFVPFRPAVPYRLAILTPARTPLSRLARAFAAVLKEEAQSIVSG